MESLLFWKNWNRQDRIIYSLLLVLFGITIVAYLVSYFFGNDIAYEWDSLKQMEFIHIKLDSFFHNFFTFHVEAPNYLILQAYGGKTIQIHPWTAYIYFSLVLISMLVIVTMLSFLDLIWYGVGMFVFIIFLATLQTDLLLIFGVANKNFLIIMLAAYLIPSYYFQAFNKTIRFLPRFLVFLLVTIGLAIAAGTLAKINDPYYLIANYGIAIPIFVAVFFMLINSFEIVDGFLYITTSGKSISYNNRLLHFTIITILYLANVLVLLLKKKNISPFTEWDVYIGPFYLLIVSSILGIWGYRRRRALFQDMMSFAPYGAYLYLCLGIITFATLGYAMITGNDPLVECMEYAIIYTHLANGAIYYLYLFFNYLEIFNQNFSIYQIAFTPRRVPFFMARGVGYIIILALVFESNQFPYKLGLAGYSNLRGDVHENEGERHIAKEHYKQGVRYEFQNQRSSYSLASLSYEDNDKKTAIEYYSNALLKKPSVHAIVNLSNLYNEQEMFFPALFTLQQGLQKYPNSSALHNNIGLLYFQKGMIDSSLYHLDIARKHADKKEIPLANIIAVISKRGHGEEAKKILEQKDYSDDEIYSSNSIAVFNQIDKKWEKDFNKDFINDTLLTRADFCYLYNYGTIISGVKDSTILMLTDSLGRKEYNQMFSEDLLAMKAYRLYYGEKPDEGKMILENLIASSQTAGQYANTLGLWMYEQKLYDLSAKYFSAAAENRNENIFLNYSIALMEQGKVNDAKIYLYQLAATKDSSIKKVTDDLIRIITENPENILSDPDALKIQYIHYNKKTISENDLNKIYNSINAEFKLYATAEIMGLYLDLNNWFKAEELYKSIGTPNDPKSYAAGEVNLQYLRILEAKKLWNELKNTAADIYLNPLDDRNRYYYLAFANEQLNNKTEADKFYKALLSGSPFNEAGRAAAANFYSINGNNQLAYDILLKGVQLHDNSAILVKAYALIALKSGYFTFADKAFADLKFLLSPSEYGQFSQQYELEKKRAFNELNME